MFRSKLVTKKGLTLILMYSCMLHTISINLIFQTTIYLLLFDVFRLVSTMGSYLNGHLFFYTYRKENRTSKMNEIQKAFFVSPFGEIWNAKCEIATKKRKPFNINLEWFGAGSPSIFLHLITSFWFMTVLKCSGIIAWKPGRKPFDFAADHTQLLSHWKSKYIQKW